MEHPSTPPTASQDTPPSTDRTVPFRSPTNATVPDQPDGVVPGAPDAAPVAAPTQRELFPPMDALPTAFLPPHPLDAPPMDAARSPPRNPHPVTNRRRIAEAFRSPSRDNPSPDRKKPAQRPTPDRIRLATLDEELSIWPAPLLEDQARDP